jgi:hypothetical protein
VENNLPTTNVFHCAPREIRRDAALIALMACVTAFGITAAALPHPWTLVPIGVGLATAVPAVRRSSRLSLVATDDRVVIKNYWRTYEFQWLDVAEVWIGAWSVGASIQPAIAFRLRDGRRRWAQATPPRSADHLAVVDHLRSLAPSSVRFHD